MVKQKDIWKFNDDEWKIHISDESLKQAEENSGDYPPILIFKRNRSKTYVTLDLEEFLKLINDRSD